LKNARALKQFSPPTAQILPAAEPTVARAQSRVTTPPLTPDLSFAANLSTDFGSPAPTLSNARATSEPRLSLTPEQIDRLSRSLSREIVFINKSDLASLSVVIRPDPRTELSVQFHRRNGEIEATIRCDRGNQELWQQHWPELQSLLADKSVRLLPLEEPRPTPLDRTLTDNPDTSSHSEKRSQPDLPEHPAAANRWPITDSGNRPDLEPMAHSTRLQHNGWETWA
jgi:hypothetical protein